MCTAGAMALSVALSTVVPGPSPGLSVSDAEATEGEDTTLDFVVKLVPAAAATVAVDYATSNGTATAGTDYTATSGTLTFAAGDTSKTTAVPIADDTVDDDGETVNLSGTPRGRRT